jgi:hypothetical protein
MTTIVAQKIWPAKAGKKFGSIIDPEGAKFMLPVGMQDAFVAGQTYDVPTSKKKWGEDVVTVIEGRPGSAGSGVVAQPAPQPATQSARQTNTQPDRDVLITSTALMKSFIETGQFGLTDLETLMKACVPAARLMVKAACGTPSQ